MVRPDRCEHYLGRAEFIPGCDGWMCPGKCAVNELHCMPGIKCQEYDKYETDPDYEGQGISGWTK